MYDMFLPHRIAEASLAPDRSRLSATAAAALMGCTPRDLAIVLFRGCVCLLWPATRVARAVWISLGKKSTRRSRGTWEPEKRLEYDREGKFPKLDFEQFKYARILQGKKITIYQFNATNLDWVVKNSFESFLDKEKCALCEIICDTSNIFLTSRYSRRKSALERYFMVDRRRVCHSGDNSNISRVVKLSQLRVSMYVSLVTICPRNSMGEKTLHERFLS